MDKVVFFLYQNNDIASITWVGWLNEEVTQEG